MTLRILRCLVLLLPILLAACGGPPTVRESTLLTSAGEKIGSMRFVYHNAKMRTTSSHSYGRGAVIADTGFDGFGGLLVKEAQAAFTARKVAVVAAAEVDAGQPLLAAGRAEEAVPVLIVAPVSGTSRGTGHATAVSYVFSARLLDPRSRRLIWQATLDTSTWVGQDFITERAEKTLYDETYARQFLKALADRMAGDGAI